MKEKVEMFGAWSGLLYVLFLVIGWAILPAFLPPHAPGADAGMVVQNYYADYFLRIKLGMIITMFAGVIYLPFSAVTAIYIKKIEGEVGMLTMLQLMGGICTAVLTFYPAMWWMVASFRPDRNPELIQLMNDMAWLQFVGGLSLFLPCVLTVALAAFMDKRAEPIFPRWVGYASLWSAVLILPDQLIFFFYDGPFAWDGLIGFWLPAMVFWFWFTLMPFILRRAIKRSL